MSELRFDGRVAIVTGAGRGLGEAYARLLAERGAQVVVNDRDGDVAEQVAADIRGAADAHDVATDGAAIVDTALDRFGRIDIVVSNAGSVSYATLPEADLGNLQEHLDVHVIGAFNVVRAAWPHMIEQGHGRVVLTTSTGMLGLPANLGYATAKAALIGMARQLRIAGRKHDIAVNLIAPAAATRMGGGDPEQLPPAQVAPIVAYLAHESCPVSGEILAAGGGRFARMFLASTQGYVDPAATVEDVAAHWNAISDESDYYVPIDLRAWSTEFLRHLA